MRTVYLAAAFAAGALLAGCSKPEPAAGAPSPNAVVVDSNKTTGDSTAKTAVPDTTKKDSTTKDSTMAVPDTAKKPS